MAHLVHDSDRQLLYDSADYDRRRSRGYNRRGFNGSLAFFALVMLVILLLWIDWSRLRSNPNTEGMIPAAENTVIRPIRDNRHLVMDELNLHEEPIDDAQVNYILPRGTRVTLLGESHQAIDGEVWLKVSVETSEGIRVGWVRQRYVV